MSRELAWPPRKEDLERLYLVDKLSAAKIARLYGLKYKNEKSAESTVLYQLRKNGIQRRESTEHIRKVTEEMVDDWVRRYQSGESLKAIADGKLSPVTIFLHLRKRGMKLRDKVDAQIKAATKHEKRPFAGDSVERAYLMGLRVGDLNVLRHGRAVRARISTTHPAMIELFRGLFSPYGHVYQYPKESQLTRYEWNLDVDLDNSFAFLLNPWVELDGILDSPSLFPAFLAGFFDAEGSIYYHKKYAHGGFEVSLSNTNEELMSKVAEGLAKSGFLGKLRRDRQSPSRGVTNGSDSIFRLSIWRHEQVSQLLRMMPLRHREKCAKRKIALKMAFGAPQKDRQALVDEWNELKSGIRRERNECIRSAEG